MINIKEIVKQPKYGFLHTNEHLKDKIIFLTLGGSHAYGTNIEGSIKGTKKSAIKNWNQIRY